MHAWVRQELRAGRGAEPGLVAGLVTRLAAVTGSAAATFPYKTTWTPSWPAGKACGIATSSRLASHRPAR